MDTKWKKIKRISGFICFIAGWTLLLGGVISLLSCFMNRRDTSTRINELVNGDYQNTREFRNYISNRLSTALDMAIGKTAGAAYGYNSYDYGYEYGYDYGYDYDYGWELVQESQGIQENAAGSFYAWSDYMDDQSKWQEATPEQNKEMADQIHARMESNKNLLYSIAYDGELLYSNADDITLDGSSGRISEDYNFMLHFDGSKVKIIKDGQELDVYGDGYYRENSDWFVPGYENFTTDETTQKADIYIAVTQEPKRYLYSRSKQPGYYQAEDELYWIQQNLQQERGRFAASMMMLVAGVLFLIVCHFQKKGRKEGEEAIAGCLGRIWLEVKVLLGLAVLALLVPWSVASGSYYGVAEDIVVSVQEISYSGAIDTYMVSQILQDIVWMIFLEPVVVIALFWLIYLAVLDIRKNHSIGKQSLTAKAIKLLRAKEVHLPFAKKMVRRCIPGVVASVLVFAAVLVAVLLENVYLLLVSLVLAVFAVCIQFLSAYRTRKRAGDMDMLAQRIAAIHAGQYEGGGEIPDSMDLSETFAKLEDIRQGMEKAIDEQVKSQRMKVELIANVSHDIKTPLTSIISYVEFLKQEDGLPEHVKDYIHILDEKSQRLKNMIQDVFAVSKAAAGQLTVNMEMLDFGKLLRQTMADMDEQINRSCVTVKAEIPEESVMIEADGQRLYRVFQNLIQNALKYSLEGSRVYITLKTDGDLAVASVKNTSRFEIDQDKDFTERFVRGDESRTDGGSGLGLSIARNFTEACGGTFQLETIADLFLVTVSFQTVSSDK